MNGADFVYFSFVPRQLIMINATIPRSQNTACPWSSRTTYFKISCTALPMVKNAVEFKFERSLEFWVRV